MADSLDAKLEEAMRVFGEDAAGELVVALLKSLADLTAESTSFMSYRSIANLVGRDAEAGELLRSVAFLSSPKVDVLAPMFVYTGVDGDEHTLSKKEWSSAKRNGFLVDPHSGEKIENFEEVTFPYFRTTPSFRHLLGVK